LNNAVEDLTASSTFSFGQAGLHMNSLNGDIRSATVDPGEGGTLNLLPSTRRSSTNFGSPSKIMAPAPALIEWRCM
jgi:hypothetical protein